MMEYQQGSLLEIIIEYLIFVLMIKQWRKIIRQENLLQHRRLHLKQTIIKKEIFDLIISQQESKCENN
ncbi:unnamed protein product [Paramecium primaurelia]|uniref:Uncharacterized protein n=1 Tax=Paramecium primaurelia TaxID=5886 RepID=A0A8S1P4T8_PARPR|nr:unnamed protein product [Paramecium primaurelia]